MQIRVQVVPNARALTTTTIQKGIPCSSLTPSHWIKGRGTHFPSTAGETMFMLGVY
jgi:hypothetical protein